MLSDRLLAWYTDNARDLPWRRTRDPYAIWVSEIMLQQTKVETVLPYFERFMERFPDVGSLAAASLDDVLLVWEGLGYYARARNLHRAAQIVVDRYSGQLPVSKQELMGLPGIGRYTADALRAFAFDRDELALEGNLRRVLTRLYDIQEDPRRPKVQKELRRLGMSILPEGDASDFNQALMDLGAMVCTPRSPICRSCPLIQDCLAFSRDTQEELPVRQRTDPLPVRQVVAAIVYEGNRVLITRRPKDGLLGALWGFPGGFAKEGESNHGALSRVIKEQLGLRVDIEHSLPSLAHTYTHFRANLQPFICSVHSPGYGFRERGDVRWVVTDELDGVPMGKLDRMLASELSLLQKR